MLESGTWIISKEWWKPSVGLFRKRPPWVDEDVARRAERRKKALSNNNPFSFSFFLLPLSHTLYFHSPFSVLLLLLCTSPPVVWTVLILMWMSTKALFGTAFKETYVSRCFCSICVSLFVTEMFSSGVWSCGCVVGLVFFNRRNHNFLHCSISLLFFKK